MKLAGNSRPMSLRFDFDGSAATVIYPVSYNKIQANAWLFSISLRLELTQGDRVSGEALTKCEIYRARLAI